MPNNAGARQREGTEWTIIYWYNANETKLPRVLLVGDSICNGYQSLVRDKLAGAAYVSFYATSKCVTDPSYLKELAHVLDEYPYAVVHFNNGLHSLDTDRKEWEAGLRASLNLLKEKGKGAKVLWATSTPLKDAQLTAKAKELNAIAAGVVKEYGFPTDDLFALMDPQDRAKLWSDTFHYTAEGREMQAKQVADMIRPLLAGRTPTAAEAQAALAGAATPTGPDGKIATVPAENPVKNGEFEAEGAWSVYPPNGESGSFELSADAPHSGKKAAKITAVKAGLQFYQHRPALAAGATYQLKYWARAEKPAKVQAHVRTQKPPYQFYGDRTVDVTTEWQEFSSKLTLPAEYQAGEHVLFFNLATPGVYWLDDISIEKIRGE